MTGFWGTRLVNDACLAADWILALGTRFKEADSSSWYAGYTFDIPPTKLIHIDIEPSEIGRNFPVEIGAVADISSALSILNDTARKLHLRWKRNHEVASRIAEFRRDFAARNRQMAESDAFPMMPERILTEVRELIPRDAVVTTDVGWNKNGVGQQFPVYVPGSVLTPGGFATMGFGPPAAIGAKLAEPERTVISLVGDGGFGQNPAMLATAVERDLAVVWLVMNNNAFGTIAGLQKAHFNTTYGTTFGPNDGTALPNYADVARAYGCEGVRISAAGELKPVLEGALRSGRPFVIDVPMKNNPTPTTGHWNILDIYTPDKHVSHVATE
jgi:acetolactate synthase-1/2/3 large subunit